MGKPGRRHDGSATAVAVGQEGQLIASAGDDGVVRLWDSQTLMARGKLSGHTTPLRSVSVSPSGARVAAASGFTNFDEQNSTERALRVWDLMTQKELLVLDQNHGGWTITAMFAGADHLLLAGQYQTVTLWDLNTRAIIRKFTPPQGMDWVNCLERSPDGRTLFAGSNGENQLHVWDFASGEYRRTLSGHEGTVLSLAAAPDLQRLASCARDGSVRIWNYHTGKELKKISGRRANPECLVWCWDGRELAIGWSDGSIRWFDPETAQELRRAEHHFGPVSGLVAIGKGEMLISTGADGTIRKWRSETAEEVDPPPLQIPVCRLGFAAGDRRLIALPYYGQPVVYELPSTEPLPPGWGHANWSGIGLSAEGERLIGHNHRYRLSRWINHESEPEPTEFTSINWFRPYALSPDASRFLYVLTGRQRARWTDLTTNVVLQEISMPGTITAVAVSADSRFATIASRPGDIGVVDLTHGTHQTQSLGELSINHVAFTADSQHVVLQTLTDLRIVSRELQGDPVVLPISVGDVSCLEVSPDNRLIIIGSRSGTRRAKAGTSRSGTLQVIPRDGRPVRTIRASWPIRSLAISSDSKAVAVAFRNGMLAIYHLPVDR